MKKIMTLALCFALFSPSMFANDKNHQTTAEESVNKELKTEKKQHQKNRDHKKSQKDADHKKREKNENKEPPKNDNKTQPEKSEPNLIDTILTR
ncbi:hypothetical protein [Providencia sneebia]|uniref:Acid shock protein n=1 Tax=Providencia sneebia DSM 19967 TaxID=1141660 RepID=K8W5N5_9GAMM|nr:hypothetical protein [Providencia sneebia]EKT55839.1 hypothetical protein OO7_12729 [Providencia sneebia DSM 19967]